MEKYPWDERDQNPEQARREAWRCIRWLVAVWVVIVVAGVWVAIEFLG